MKVLKSNEFWGRHGGGFFDPTIPKGHTVPVGLSIRQQQWSCGVNNNKPRRRSIGYLLAHLTVRSKRKGV